MGEFLLGILMSGLPPDRWPGSDLVDIAKLKKIENIPKFMFVVKFMIDPINCTPCINIIYVIQYSYF